MLTDEEVLEIAELLTWYDADVERLDPMQFARAIEAKIEAKLREQNEPVGYFHPEYMGGPVLYFPVNYSNKDEEGVVPLWEHPAPIPEGMVLVPIEPTEAMIDKVIDERMDALINGTEHTFIDIYKAMLEAARSGE